MSAPALFRRSALRLCLSLPALQALSIAQEYEPDGELIQDLGELSLEELMEVEVDTVYAASKQVQKVTEAPSSVTILTADDIQSFGYQSLSQLLEGVRGFYLTYDRNYDRLGVRGFGPPGDYTTRVLVLIDGHRVNDVVYSGAATGNEFPLDIDLIERVEIIRGPGSSLYGSNAFLGVINVITRSGASIRGLEAEAGAGTHRTVRARLTAGDAKENGADVLVSVSTMDSRGGRLFYPEYANTPSGGWTDGKDDEQGTSFFASASRGDWRFFAAHSSREKGIPTGAYGTVFDTPGNETIDAYTLLDIAWDKELDDDYSVLARLFYDDFDYSGEYVYDYEDDGPPFTVNEDHGEGESFGGELQLTWTGREAHRLTSGIEVRQLASIEQRNFDEGGTVYLEDERDGTFWGVFVQDEIAISESVRLTAGVRHDDYYSFGGTTNPRLALVWAADEDTTLKALYGRAFRAPNAYELYYEDSGTAKANPNLDAERIETYELVWEEVIRAGCMGSVAVYRFGIDDLITQMVDPGDGLLVFGNQDEVTADGVEFELDGRTEGGLHGAVSYAHQRVRDEATDESIPNSPEHMAKARIALPLFGSGWQAGLEVIFTGDRQTLQGGEAEDSFAANLTLLRREICRGIDLSLTIRNLFDRENEHPGSGEHLQDTIEQEGRTFFFGVRGQF